MKRIQTNTLRNLAWFASQPDPVTWAEVADDLRQMPQSAQNILKRYTADGLLHCETRPTQITSNGLSKFGKPYECTRTVMVRHYTITPKGVAVLAEHSDGRDLTPTPRRSRIVANSIFNYAASL